MHSWASTVKALVLGAFTILSCNALLDWYDKRLTTTISQSSELVGAVRSKRRNVHLQTQKQPVPSYTTTDIQNARLESAHE
jgi:hypothetical protein